MSKSLQQRRQYEAWTHLVDLHETSQERRRETVEAIVRETEAREAYVEARDAYVDKYGLADFMNSTDGWGEDW